MTNVIMPQMGESIAEGTISVWLVDVGQVVEMDQPLVTVSTDKADVDIPSPAGGVLTEIFPAAGETVKVGALIARIDETSAARMPAKDAKQPDLSTKKEGPAEPPLKKEGVPAAEAVSPKPPERPMIPPQEIKREGTASEPVAEDRSGFYSPAVMRLAVERGIDLRQIKGTGEGGRVTKSDVMRAVEGAPSPQPIPPGGGGERGEGVSEGIGSYRPPVYSVEEGDKATPFSGLRRLIADHMVYSKRTSAHVTTVAEANLEKVAHIRAGSKGKVKSETGISLTYLPFVMFATVRALKEFPLMNSVVQADTIITKRQINLGVAVDSERGLVVAVVRKAEDMGLVGLARVVNELSIKVRDKKITPDELTGGTFTVTNPGRHGNLFGTPIISQPQAGIIRLGEVVKRPVVIEADGEDAIAIHPMMYLSLSYDHRVVDGLTANEFLHRIKEHLEEGDFQI